MSVSYAIRIPAAAANAEPMANACKITLLEGMPAMLLSSGLLATARIFRPVRLCFMKKMQAMNSVRQIAIVVICVSVMYAPRNSFPVFTSPVLMAFVSSPQSMEIRFCKTVYRPREASISIIGEALRFLRGLYRASSDSVPAAVAQVMDRGIEIGVGRFSCMENR